jgi:pimeloyl-ACP methyl ester carboxylesterase
MSAAVFSAVLRAVRRGLDESVSDVMNYVLSASRLLTNPPVDHCAGQVDERVRLALSRARARSPDRTVVVAHSLGSVIAYRVLLGEGEATSPYSINRLVTVGSPLTRFGFAWPWTLRPREPTFSWINFFDPFDFVSARLRSTFPWGAQNVLLFGRTGLRRSHTTYQYDPHVHRAIGEAIGIGSPQKGTLEPSERARQIALSIQEFGAQLGLVFIALATATVISAALSGVLGVIVGSVSGEITFFPTFIGTLGFTITLPLVAGLQTAIPWIMLIYAAEDTRAWRVAKHAFEAPSQLVLMTAVGVLSIIWLNLLGIS